MEEFERGVQKFVAFIDADTERDEAESHFEWKTWSDENSAMIVDVQIEARKRFQAARGGK